MAFVELTISCKPELAEILIAQISDYCQGFIETEDGLLAYLEEDSFGSKESQSVLKRLVENHPVELTTRLVKQENWNAIWEQNFEPVVIADKCRIRASFHPESTAYPFEIIINPKMSFGTGHHETTSLMVSLLLEMNLNGKSVLDVGCGTGILTILGSKLGAHYLEAVDIEEIAIENSLENMGLNQTIGANLHQGTIRNVYTKNFDLILANLRSEEAHV